LLHFAAVNILIDKYIETATDQTGHFLWLVSGIYNCGVWGFNYIVSFHWADPTSLQNISTLTACVGGFRGKTCPMCLSPS